MLGAVVCASTGAVIRTGRVVSAAKRNACINSSRGLRRVAAPQLKAFEHPKIGAMFKPEHIRQIGVERRSHVYGDRHRQLFGAMSIGFRASRLGHWTLGALNVARRLID